MRGALIFMIVCLGAQAFEQDSFNIRDASMSFTSLLDLPPADQYKTLQSITGNTFKIAATFVPYGESVASALTSSIESDKLAEVLQATDQIESSLATIRREQDKFREELLALHLTTDYYKEVTSPIENMYQLLASLYAHGFQPPSNKLDAFKNGCNLNYRPQAIARYLKFLVANCGSPDIDSNLISKIYAHLQDYGYFRHRSETGDKWPGIHTSAIYSCLLPLTEHERNRAFVKLQHLVLSNQLVGESGLYLIETEICDKKRAVPTTYSSACLAKSLFVSSEFKSTQVLKLASNIMQYYNATIALSVICANVTNRGNQEAATMDTNFVLKDLEPVNKFISSWIPAFINSTWTEIESVLVKNVLHGQYTGLEIPRQQSIYEEIVGKINSTLSGVGSMSYSRQFIVLPSPGNWPTTTKSTFGCASANCFHVSAYNVDVYIIRQPLLIDDYASKGAAIEQFADNKKEAFDLAVRKLKRENPEYIVSQLDNSHDFQLETLIDKSFYLLVVNRASLTCSLPVATMKEAINGHSLMVTLNSTAYYSTYLGTQCSHISLFLAA